MAQTAEEALVVRMEATLTKFERQMQRAKQVAEGTSVGMERRFDSAAKRMASTADRASASVTKLGDSGKSMGYQIQNASYQIGDFAVQVAGGTDPMRAMAQQLPQLLGGLGMFGAVAGAAAAIMVPLISAMGGAGDSAKALNDAVTDTTNAIKSYRDASEVAAGTSGELFKQFGSASPVMRQALADLAGIEKIKAYESLDQLAGSLRGVVLEASIFSDASANTLAQGFLGFTRNSQLARDEAQQFLALLDQLNNADPQIRLDTAIMLRAMLVELTGGYEQMDASQKQVYEGLTKTIVNLETLGIRATDAAIEFAGIGDAAAAVGPTIDDLRAKTSSLASTALQAAANILSAAKASAEMYAANRQLEQMKFEFSPGGQAMMKYGSRGTTSDAPVTDGRGWVLKDGEFVDPNAKPGSGGRRVGGGGGGRDPVDDVTQKYQRLIATLDPLARAEQQFAEAQETVNEALSRGVITSEEAARATALIGEEYVDAIAKANDAAGAFSEINDQLKDAILDMAADGVNSFDQLASAIKRAAFEALLFGSGPMAGLFGGGNGLLGGIIGAAAPVKVSSAPRIAPQIAAAAVSHSGAAQINVNVSGARGNAEIESMVAQGVRSGIAQYDRQALPTRIKQISADGRRIG